MRAHHELDRFTFILTLTYTVTAWPIASRTEPVQHRVLSDALIDNSVAAHPRRITGREELHCGATDRRKREHPGRHDALQCQSRSKGADREGIKIWQPRFIVPCDQRNSVNIR